jgi:hypothetical protein
MEDDMHCIKKRKLVGEELLHYDKVFQFLFDKAL